MTKAKLAALGIVIVYVAAAASLGVEPREVLWQLVGMLVGVCLICFPDQLGSVTGVGASLAHPGGVDTETPGCVVAALGWLFLAGVPIAFWGLS